MKADSPDFERANIISISISYQNPMIDDQLLEIDEQLISCSMEWHEKNMNKVQEEINGLKLGINIQEETFSSQSGKGV